MDLLRLYLVNILRPVVEDPKLHDHDNDDDEENADERTSSSSDEPKWAPDGKRKRTPSRQRESHRKPTTKGGHFKNIELLDSSGPKLIHGIQRWFVLYQIIGQLNWLERPLILSIIYKMILIPTCGYIVYKDILKSLSASRITDEFKNPIFVFISLSSAATLILLATLTVYNNLFNWCPLFKVLTTERLCFLRREAQDIIGNNTLPPMLCFYAYNCVLFKMLTTRNFQEFINTFDVIDYVRDLFVFLCVGHHLIGMCYTDFYIRICFGLWIFAMKNNLENRFAYLQKHQRVKQRSSLRERSSKSNVHPSGGAPSNHKPTSSSVASNYSTSSANSSMRNDDMGPDSSNADFEVVSKDDSIATAATATTPNAGTIEGGAKPDQGRVDSWLTNTALDDFKAKYKIETMDEIQKNLNTMDDHLEVSRDFQNSSLVLITLSAFLTNGALFLLAYNLLANQGDYYHGLIIVLIAANYTITIFTCYIGDSWLLYALESFVQTVEDEYFLQSADDRIDHEHERPEQGPAWGQSAAHCGEPLATTSGQAEVGPSSDWTSPPAAPAANSETCSETMPYSNLIKQNHQLFIIKKRDVLFCREFVNQFQNHLATPWSKLTVKVQLHMLRTFITLIAAQIIFDREH